MDKKNKIAFVEALICPCGLPEPNHGVILYLENDLVKLTPFFFSKEYGEIVINVLKELTDISPMEIRYLLDKLAGMDLPETENEFLESLSPEERRAFEKKTEKEYIIFKHENMPQAELLKRLPAEIFKMIFAADKNIPSGEEN